MNLRNEIRSTLEPVVEYLTKLIQGNERFVIVYWVWVIGVAVVGEIYIDTSCQEIWNVADQVAFSPSDFKLCRTAQAILGAYMFGIALVLIKTTRNPNMTKSGLAKVAGYLTSALYMLFGFALFAAGLNMAFRY